MMMLGFGGLGFLVAIFAEFEAEFQQLHPLRIAFELELAGDAPGLGVLGGNGKGVEKEFAQFDQRFAGQARVAFFKTFQKICLRRTGSPGRAVHVGVGIRAGQSPPTRALQTRGSGGMIGSSLRWVR